MAYLYVRPGAVEAVREYIEQTWPNQFAVLESVHAIQAGLFGPEYPQPALFNWVGDLVVVAKRNVYLWWSGKEDFLLGRHGGLQPDEMLVPFLAAALLAAICLRYIR